MKELQVGTRIYNGGDMANVAHFGTITAIHKNARFGDQYQITPDPGSERNKPYAITPAAFSEKYEGHGGTRFVTEDAYKEWREKRMSAFKKKEEKTMKHTPRSWQVSGSGDFVKSQDHSAICRMAYNGVWKWAAGIGTLEDRANARLIAAAPDLLDALKNVLDELHKHHKMNVKKDYSLMVADSVARKAIAKAEGRL